MNRRCVALERGPIAQYKRRYQNTGNQTDPDNPNYPKPISSWWPPDIGRHDTVATRMFLFTDAKVPLATRSGAMNE
jgi:hypothetical protein